MLWIACASAQKLTRDADYTIVNLRGLRESGALVAAPTYAFIISIIGIVIVGTFQVFTSTNFYTEPTRSYSIGQLVPTLTLFIVLQAFSAGCTAMTGVEAISNAICQGNERKPYPRHRAS